MRNSRKFEDTIVKWGKQWESIDELFSYSKEFIYTLYGNKENVWHVNKVWRLKFRGKHTKQNKVIDMPALSPCKETLKLHSARENYVAKNVEIVFAKQYGCAPSFSGRSLDSEGTIEWVHNPFPSNMNAIFFDTLFDEDDCESGR